MIQVTENFKVHILGYGGAFDIVEKNSAILIESKQYGNVLVDCGNTVYRTLRQYEDIKAIDGVIITHMHDDHIGSLGTLIFDRWFTHKLPTRVITHPQVMPSLKAYLELSHTSEQYELFDSVISEADTHLLLVDTTNFHVRGLPSCGIIFQFPDNGETKYFLYSGDICIPIFMCLGGTWLDKFNKKNTVCMHDISFVDYPENVHCYIGKLLPYNDKMELYGYHYSDKAVKAFGNEIPVKLAHQTII